MSTVAKNLRLFWVHFRYNLYKETENRASFFSQIIFMVLNNASFIVQWIIFFSLQGGLLYGVSMSEILMIWAVFSGIYGVSHFFFENIYFLPQLIITGQLDAYLVQPANVLWSVAISRVNVAALGDLLYGLILILFAAPLKLPIFLFFIVLGGATLTAVMVIGGSLAFWLKRADFVSNSLNFALLAAGSYPSAIFRGFAKVLIYTVLPVAFMVHMPASLLLRFSPKVFLIAVVASCSIIFAAFRVFRAGILRYSSTNAATIRI